MSDCIILSGGNNQDPFSGKKLTSFCFDDAPESVFINGYDRPGDYSPANAIDAWLSANRTESCAAAVVAIAISDPGSVEKLGYDPDLEGRLRSAYDTEELAGHKLEASRICQALGAMAMAKRQVEEAIGWYRKFLDIHLELPEFDKPSLSTGLGLFMKCLRENGMEIEAKRTRLNVMVHVSLKEKDYYWARSLALELYKIGEFARAEEAYLAMVEADFSLASVYCHLARVQVMMDRFEDARVSVEKAASVESNCPPYVKARIHYLKAMFKMLDEKSPRESLCEIKTILGDPNSHLEWDINDMLVHLEKRVSEKHYTLLRMMKNALEHRSNRAQLEENLIWRFSTSDPLDVLRKRFESPMDPPELH